MEIKHLVFNDMLYRHKSAVQQLYQNVDQALFNPDIFNQSLSIEALDDQSPRMLHMHHVIEVIKDTHINHIFELNRHGSMLLVHCGERSMVCHMPIILHGGVHGQTSMMVTFILEREEAEVNSEPFMISDLISAFKDKIEDYYHKNNIFVEQLRSVNLKYKQFVSIFYYLFKHQLNVRYSVNKEDKEYLNKEIDKIKDSLEPCFLMVNSIMLMMTPPPNIEQSKKLNRKYIRDSVFTFDLHPPEVVKEESQVDFNYHITTHNGDALLFHLSLDIEEHEADEYFKQFEDLDESDSITFNVNDVRMLVLDGAY